MAQDYRTGLGNMMGHVERPRPPSMPEDEQEAPPPSPLERPDERDDEPEEPEGRQTIPEPIADLRERLAAESARREGMERELEFLRRGQFQGQEVPQADPVREAMNLFRVDPHTWNQMIADPERGAEMATNALQSAILIGSQLSQNHQQAVLQQVAQHMHAQQQQSMVDREGDDMKRAFWEQNQNLLPYQRLVRQHAAEVAAEVRQGRSYSSDQVLHEIGSRTRSELREAFNIDVPEPRRQNGRVTSMQSARDRFRPAAAEMGTGLGRRSAPMSAVQKSIYRLARR